jgi:hypothetical protein
VRDRQGHPAQSLKLAALLECIERARIEPGEATHRLLRLAEQRLRLDPGPVHLEGAIALVVRGEKGDAHWCAVFHRGKAAYGLLPFVPEEVDAVALIDEAWADSALSGAPVRPSDRCEVAGDTALYHRFVDRYLAHRSQIDVRATTRRGS